MADLSVFSTVNFNSNQWINGALKDMPDEESLETYTSQLLMKLHILSQEYTDQLEGAMIESMSTMPRVMSEISRLEEQLKSITKEMHTLSSQLNAFDQRNVAGVEDLSRLDTLKSNMIKCKATLEEHARWSQLVREAKTLLESGGRLSDSADRIEVMFRSLEILKSLPGHDERVETCETFKNSLLDAVRPRLRRDVAELDLTPLQEYSYVFTKLGREIELEDAYVKIRPERVKSLWNDYDSTDKLNNFAEWLALYFGKVTRLIHDEQEKSATLFGNTKGYVVLRAMLIEVLNPMSFQLNQRLYTISNPVISYDSYSVTDEFTKRILGYFESNENITEEKLMQMLTAIYSGFMNYYPNYIECEISYLRNEFNVFLNLITFDSSNISSEQSNNLDSLLEYSDPSAVYMNFSEQIIHSCENVFAPIEISLERMTRYMGGMQIKSLLKALASTLNAFLKSLIGKIHLLGVACGYTKDRSQEREVSQDSGLSAAHSYAMQLETSELDTHALLSCSLRALQATGRLAKKFYVFENYTKSLLSELQNVLFSVNSVTSGGNLNSLVTNAAHHHHSIGAVYAAYLIQSDTNSLSEMKSFLVSSSSTSHHMSHSVYSILMTPIGKFKTAAGSLFFHICLREPERILSNLQNDTDIWETSNEVVSSYIKIDSAVEAFSEENMSALKDHLLPQSVITQVGEHMLSLVQELESFASSDALSDLLVLKGEAQSLPVKSKGWQQIKAVLQIKDDEALSKLSRRSNCCALISQLENTLYGSVYSLQPQDMEVESSVGGVMNLLSSSVDDTVEENTNAAVLGFVNEWLGAVSDSALGLLIHQIVGIKSLTVMGCAQLLTDIDYISNVTNAMGIRTHPLLLHMKQLLQSNPHNLLEKISMLQAKNQALNMLLTLDHFLLTAVCEGLSKE